MRVVWLAVCVVLASACASHGVRCSKHLRPINVAAPGGTAPGAKTERP